MENEIETKEPEPETEYQDAEQGVPQASARISQDSGIDSPEAQELRKEIQIAKLRNELALVKGEYSAQDELKRTAGELAESISNLNEQAPTLEAMTNAFGNLEGTVHRLEAVMSTYLTTLQAVNAAIDKKHKEYADLEMREAAYAAKEKEFNDKYKDIKYYKAIEEAWEHVPEKIQEAVCNKYLGGIRFNHYQGTRQVR